jgi:hypothetical protein
LLFVNIAAPGEMQSTKIRKLVRGQAMRHARKKNIPWNPPATIDSADDTKQFFGSGYSSTSQRLLGSCCGNGKRIEKEKVHSTRCETEVEKLFKEIDFIRRTSTIRVPILGVSRSDPFGMSSPIKSKPYMNYLIDHCKS